MPGGDRRGPQGMGPMTGGGRGICNSRGTGTRNCAFPRGASYTSPRYEAYSFRPFVPQVRREQELEFLKDQAKVLKDELKQLESEIEILSARKKE